ncbi:RTA1 like protein-domain-containing protein [Xylariales sp. PMI_506]|nr:RTA1 like protein-domain-containing protein [Xylariales sp. PMI_506]
MTVNPYGYTPNQAAAMIFVVLFGVTTIWHGVIMFRRRAWYFCVLVLGGCLETAGYICRFLSHDNPASLVLFIVQTLTILVAPALFAASIYMVLGRLIRLVRAESISPVRPSLLTKIFVGGDLLSFLVQVVGSSSLSSNFSLAKTIILVGLVVQILFFGLFVVVAVAFQRRLARNPTQTALRLDQEAAESAHSTRPYLGWKGVVRVIYLVSAMIFTRSIFRLIEFTGSSDSPMMKTEAYLYVCDSTLMFIALAILIYYHPASYVPTQKHILALRDQELA